MKTPFTKILSIGLISTVLSANSFGQESNYYQPGSGDWAISIDAAPFLTYAGNLIGGGQNANNAPSWNYLTTNQTITAKYYKNEKMAYRGYLRLGFGGDTDKRMVLDRSIDPTTAPVWPTISAEVENKHKWNTTNIGLGAGVEFRKGKRRLFGIYGAELGFNITSGKSSFTYGNALTSPSSAVDVNITSADDFGVGNIVAGGNIDGQGNANDYRVLSSKSGTGFGIGLRGFIGAEYFLLQKLSLSGEFGWGVGYFMSGTGSESIETEGLTTTGTETQVETIESKTAKSSRFSLDTDNINSLFGPAFKLKLTFYISDHVGGRFGKSKKPTELENTVSNDIDSDGDGLIDRLDKCPNTPGTIEGCPDTDGDGIVDSKDDCPDVAGTLNGCPDTDGDGFADNKDECPTVAGTINGCPENDKDTDGDGISDGKDACPTVPGTINGCPDTDGDGVIDSEDDCPTVKGTIKGCPDTDGDGIADKDDACPEIAGKAELNGCPLSKEELQTIKVSSEKIYFNSGSSTIKNESFPDLDKLAEILVKHPEVKASVEGHTDSQGNDNLNLQLSQSRADAVKDYLISKGVNAGGISATGFGETKPIADNATSAGRAKNRRVIIVTSLK